MKLHRVNHNIPTHGRRQSGCVRSLAHPTIPDTGLTRKFHPVVAKKFADDRGTNSFRPAGASSEQPAGQLCAQYQAHGTSLASRHRLFSDLHRRSTVRHHHLGQHAHQDQAERQRENPQAAAATFHYRDAGRDISQTMFLISASSSIDIFVSSFVLRKSGGVPLWEQSNQASRMLRRQISGLQKSAVKNYRMCAGENSSALSPSTPIPRIRFARSSGSPKRNTPIARFMTGSPAAPKRRRPSFSRLSAISCLTERSAA